MLLRSISLLSILIFSIELMAARSVSITIPSESSGSLKLTNPSTVTVTYDYACYKFDGSALGSATNQTLAPSASIKITAGAVDSGKCASDASPYNSGGTTDANGKKYYLCGGAQPYSSAESLCGVGQALCFPAPSSANQYANGQCSVYYWVKDEADLEYSPSCGSYSALATAEKVFINAYSGTIRKSGSTNAFWGGKSNDGSESYGATCCEASVYPGYCKVTIQSTDSAAHLSSPYFKGGAPF